MEGSEQMNIPEAPVLFLSPFLYCNPTFPCLLSSSEVPQLTQTCSGRSRANICDKEADDEGGGQAGEGGGGVRRVGGRMVIIAVVMDW